MHHGLGVLGHLLIVGTSENGFERKLLANGKRPDIAGYSEMVIAATIGLPASLCYLLSVRALLHGVGVIVVAKAVLGEHRTTECKVILGEAPPDRCVRKGSPQGVVSPGWHTDPLPL